jgi:uncharacterized repeat protein (TIGR01451 family)
LALDGDSYPHIAYQAVSPKDHDLNYARWTGSQWAIEIVDSAGDTGWVLQSLELDDAGHPHIGYGGNQYTKFRYAHWTGSDWAIEDVGVDPTAWGYSGGSFTLDSHGYPHMAYCIQTEIPGPKLIITLRYAHWTGSKWVIEDVDSDDCWFRTSLKLDVNDRPHISYYGQEDGDLKYAHWTGSEWDIQVVDDYGYVGQPNSLALDTNGYPHISYYSWTANTLKYARWTGSDWEIQDVDSAGGLDYVIETVLALDASDYAHIAYVDDTNSLLKYAYWTGDTWGIEIVDTGEHIELGSMVLDDTGNPHMSYTDPADHLRYAVRTLPPLLLDKQAEPDEGLHSNDTLTYTLTITGTGLNVRLWDPLPSTVSYISGSLTSTIAPAAVYSPMSHAARGRGHGSRIRSRRAASRSRQTSRARQSYRSSTRPG